MYEVVDCRGDFSSPRSRKGGVAVRSYVDRACDTVGAEKRPASLPPNKSGIACICSGGFVMSYQALYRQWRPSTFSEIVGQDAVVKTLRRQVETGRVAHAYLFSGTRGTGKTTAAKVLARAINCENPSRGDPCGVCPTCVALKAENSMDVLEIDAASNNGVDEIRDLREKVNYPPAVAKYRVYIIDEVHMLSTGAFNALLKTLEEPPRHAVFILATTEPQKLPATILSRCQRFDFKRLPADTIVERMMVVLGGIGRTATEEALSEIARAAEGAMRDALSILDVCLSYTDGEVDIALVRDALGTAGTPFLFEFADALIGYDARTAILLIDRLLRDGLDAQVFARDVAGHLRSLLLAQVAGDALAGLLECTAEDANRFREQAAHAERSQLFRLMELFLRAEPDMKWIGSPRALLELLAVRACHPEKEGDAALGERLARVERALGSGAMPTPAQPPRPPAPASPKRRKSRPKPAASPRRAGRVFEGASRRRERKRRCARASGHALPVFGRPRSSPSSRSRSCVHEDARAQAAGARKGVRGRVRPAGEAVPPARGRARPGGGRVRRNRSQRRGAQGNRDELRRVRPRKHRSDGLKH